MPTGRVNKVVLPSSIYQISAATPLGESLAKLFKSCIKLADKKSVDYCGREEFSSFKLSSAISGISVEKSILVRIADKLSRLKVLLDNEVQVKEESIEDTIIDAINYLGIIYAFRMGQVAKGSNEDKG